MDDGALLAGLSSGEPDVGLAFVRRFQRQVFGAALAVVGDPGLAEDIAQQTFERAWRKAASFDATRGSVRSWLTAIAHNSAVDAVRGRPPAPLDPADLVRLVGAAGDDPAAASAHAEAVAELRRELSSLPAEQARAVVMAAVYGLTAQEIATAEAIPLGTAKTRIRAGMQKLRAALAPAGGDRG